MCDCIEKMDAVLEAKNTTLDVPITVSSGTLTTKGVLVATRKLDSSKRAGPIKLFATYCPFCGEMYEEVA